MIYVGIDIAKFTHYAAVMDGDGVVHHKPFPFDNSISGFNLLLAKLAPFGKTNLVVGLESTSHYGNNLVDFLFKHEFKVAMINPIKTSALRKGNIRNVKTDSIDAMLVIKSLIVDGYRLLTPNDLKYQNLKSLTATRHNLVKQRSRAKIQLHALVDQVFPELHNFFTSGINIACAKTLLKRFPLPQDVSKVRIDTLTKLLSSSSHGRYKSSKAAKLKELAANSIGHNDPTLALEIKLLVEQIELYDRQVDEAEAVIADIMQTVNSPMLSVPGLGTVNSAIILGHIGDIFKFPSDEKMLAFAGLTPIIRQSGQFKAKFTRMSKRGSPLLRYGLINAAHNVARNVPVFAAYYAKKIAQGKSHYNALGHVAAKLVRLIYALLTRNISFDPKLSA
jgi:transposase